MVVSPSSEGVERPYGYQVYSKWAILCIGTVSDTDGPKIRSWEQKCHFFFKIFPLSAPNFKNLLYSSLGFHALSPLKPCFHRISAPEPAIEPDCGGIDPDGHGIILRLLWRKCRQPLTVVYESDFENFGDLRCEPNAWWRTLNYIPTPKQWQNMF